MSRTIKETADRLDQEAARLRREAVRQLRENGLTFGAIGAELGISRQRAQQLWNDREADAPTTAGVA